MGTWPRSSLRAGLLPQSQSSLSRILLSRPYQVQCLRANSIGLTPRNVRTGLLRMASWDSSHRLSRDAIWLLASDTAAFFLAAPWPSFSGSSLLERTPSPSQGQPGLALSLAWYSCLQRYCERALERVFVEWRVLVVLIPALLAIEFLRRRRGGLGGRAHEDRAAAVVAASGAVHLAPPKPRQPDRRQHHKPTEPGPRSESNRRP